MKKYKILFFSSGRSDFELLLPIINKLQKNKSIQLNLIISGSHLSKRHGYTINEVKKHKIKNIKKINIKCEKVNEKNIYHIFTRSQKLYSNFINSFKNKVHLAVVLGDRYEALSFGLSCFFQNIHLAHIHGGEITNGSKDDTIRHILTKLSNLHFVSHSSHKKRVLQLGESNQNIHNFGLLEKENILKLKLNNKKQITNLLKIDANKDNILVSYHPVTVLSKKQNKIQFQQVLSALLYFKNHNIIFTAPNIDPGNLDILKMTKKFVEENSNAFFFESLGQKKFFSLAKNSKIFIGNSSSGILEIPFLNIPVLDIGIRQEGRHKFQKVHHSSANRKNIINKINNILKNKIKTKNKMNSKNTSRLISASIINYLKYNKFDNQLKKFKDLKV